MTQRVSIAPQLEQLGGPTLERLRLVAHAARDRAWLVGGYVRDLLLGREPGDIDIVVECDARKLARELPVEVLKTTEFMTATVRWPDGEEWDLATARAESYPSPGALPVVRRGTIEEDLLRRDFTINAMAAAIWPRRWGEVLDPTGGLLDLHERRVRPLHERSYLDDPTRLFRALRYRARLDFRLDPLSAMIVHRDEMCELVGRLSGDRIRHELERSLGGPDAAEQLMWLRGVTWLESVLPHVSPLLDSIDGATDAFETLDGTWVGPLRTWLVWLLALVPTGKAAEDAPAIIERLSLDRPGAEIVQSFVRLLRQRLSPGDTCSLIAKRFDGAPVEALVALAARRWVLLPAVRWYLAEGRHVRPELNGHSLLAAGLPEGPLIGKILDELRFARLDGKIESVDDEWRLARRLAERAP